ncbi:MAG: AmmeMemoRadiSam system radical SAM enzyme [Candidatus Hadarchaeales archaeon]
MRRRASFWRKSDSEIVCVLCPRNCRIAPGKTGFCGARRNEDGILYTLSYGAVVSWAPDPIEKKPLYHFWPGSSVFSIAAPGCTFSCLHCQNWSISQTRIGRVETEEISPDELIHLTKQYGCQGIAHTYTEPTIWTEYAIDVGKLARAEGLYNVYVTNGYITAEALEELGPYLDAANVDVKAFRDDFYRKICGVSSLKPVLEACEWMHQHKIHLELTYLIIPGENDREEEIRDFCRWVREELDPEVPVHFSRFYPHYRMLEKPPTPVETLERAHKVAKGEGLQYVYLGNVPGHQYDNTYCPGCGSLLISRYGFSVLEFNLEDGKCPGCGRRIRVVGKFSG